MDILNNDPVTVSDAVAIAKDRNGMAQEWDHVLAEAALMLSAHATSNPRVPRVSVDAVRQMGVGDTLLVSAEGRNRTQKSWRGQTQTSMLATRLKYKLTTRVMILVDPTTMSLSPVIHITRTA